MSVSTTVKTIQDIMRKDAGVDGDAQRISQLGWMLFLKIFDDREKEYELISDDYQSPIPQNMRWRSWAAKDEGITGNALLKFLDNELFPTLKDLSADAGSNGSGIIVRRVFEDSYNYMKDGTLIRQVANKINEIDFNRKSDRHLFGEIYEKILKDLQSAGNAGEYYTPRAVTQFMVDMVNPQLGEVILDPACGTGGFLTCAIENIRSAQVKSIENERLLQQSINGIEKKPMPHLLCITNMMLHGIDVPTRIRHDNTLARPLRDYGLKDQVDVIVTNPPFGGIEVDGIEHNFPSVYKTRETADLFLVLITHILKDGGRAAIVLPDGGNLNGGGAHQRIREKLLAECNLHTIIRLPAGVFNPYTAIKTNLLFFKKGSPTKTVWFYEHPYPEGYKSYSKTNPIQIEEFESEKKWWNNRVENEYAWKVSIESLIESGYNLDIKNPNSKREIENPSELLNEFTNISNSIIDLQERIKLEFLQSFKMQKINSQFTFDSIINNIQIISEAPNGVSKLRDFILQLAMQGKLTIQLSTDDSVELLLKKIESVKEKMIKEGEIKRSSSILPINKEKIPFRIPNNWEYSRLGTIAQYNAEEKFSAKDISEDSWILDLEDIEKDTSKIVQKIKFYERKSLSTKSFFKKGDILYGKLRPYLNKVIVADSDGYCTTEIVPIRPYFGIVPKFLMYSLKRPDFLEYINSKTSGRKMPRIRTNDAINALIPIPPLAEQHRIVAKVDALMALCDALESRLKERAAVQGRLANAIVKQIGVGNA